MAPFVGHRTTVKPRWVDHNGHMGIRSYTPVFDKGVIAFYRHIGLTRANLLDRGTTIFALQECHWYRREVMLDDPLEVTVQMLDLDHNKLVTFATIRQTRDGYDVAMTELIEIHIDLATRRAAPFATHVRARLDAVMAEHAGLPRPAVAGQGVGIRRSA
ncbi:MAG: hypothetical protein FJX36_04995 [Alphaproteobacteria bacterium]|nr:hypothetical protein [Alphaproteobacteria bacterium]